MGGLCRVQHPDRQDPRVERSGPLRRLQRLRRDHESKFSLRWTPVRELLVRGSWGTSFIAPSLTQAYGGNTSGVTAPGQNDPLRCPTTGDSNDCDTQFPVTFGGNDQLKPQTATQWQVGFVFEPVRQFSIGIEFNIDTENLFSNGLSQSFILSNLDTYGYLVRRGPVSRSIQTSRGRSPT